MCLCPRYLIDTSAIKVLQASTLGLTSTGEADKRKAVTRNSACSISVITSLPASRGDVVGNFNREWII